MKTSVYNLTRIVCTCAAALLITLAPGSLASADEPPATTSATAPAIPGARSARAATPAEIAAYTERDQKANKELGEFAGGDIVIIGASTVAIVLIVVLILLLI